MAIYLKEFENHTQYENYINGSGAILPNVSICTTEGDVHYNLYVPPTPVETRVVATFNVTDTSNPTQIMVGYADSQFSAIEIDGVEQQSVTTSYTFDSKGEHTVKYTLSDPTSIGNYAFYNCTGLTSIDIPNNVTSIGTYVFVGCTKLKSCTIGSGITSIGQSAFQNCGSLKTMTVEAEVPPTLGISALANAGSGTGYGITIYVPSSSVIRYKAASGWSEYASKIQAIP